MNGEERDYQTPGIERREPVGEPLIGGSGPSPAWRSGEDGDDGAR